MDQTCVFPVRAIGKNVKEDSSNKGIGWESVASPRADPVVAGNNIKQRLKIIRDNVDFFILNSFLNTDNYL